jgi:hypothetical protein
MYIQQARTIQHSARSNVEAETTSRIIANRELPLSIVILILIVVGVIFCLYSLVLMIIDWKIEHALKEWENGKKAHKVGFVEDIAKHRFDFLLL